MLLTTSSFTICEDEGANRKKEQKKKSNFFSSFNGLLDPNKMVIKVEWKTFFIQELEMHHRMIRRRFCFLYIFVQFNLYYTTIVQGETDKKGYRFLFLF